MDRLSRAVSAMAADYDVVVVGSGYGGGVAASRLARAGARVCLLERGREIQPGEYPDTAVEAAAQTQVSVGSRHVGSRLGLLDFHVNADMSALVGCGLGGTSLINANVSIKPDGRVFQHWPAALQDPAVLDPYYERAVAMLKPQPYPATYPALPKLAAHEQSASALAPPNAFSRPPLNVNFSVSGPNHVDTVQHPCNNCGDCVSGCNVRAKNTTLMNYLPDARNHGAHIFTQCSVKHVQKEQDGQWVVHFDWLGSGREAFRAPALSVRAPIVVLAAGTLGSTGILLRSRAQGLEVSPRLGQRFSSNGDVLAFAYDCRERIDGVGYGHRKPADDRPVGPCITGLIDRRATANLDDGSIIEEGSIPGAIASLLPVAFAAADAAQAGMTPDGFADRLENVDETLVGLLTGPRHGAVDRTQTYLVMSHDGSDGTLALDGEQVRIDWPGVGSKPVFQSVDKELSEATAPLGGSYLRDPFWTKALGSRLVTVHPLGGCAMADDAASGVVNDRGQVFCSGSGSDVHEGLYVADGAVMPSSLGVNPLLTITAVAERTVDLLARERGWAIDFAPTSRRPSDWPEARPGVRFTETMRGYWSRTEGLDYQAAAAAGEAAGDTFEFTLTIESDDLAALIGDAAHAARMAGTIGCPSLSPTPLTVHDGEFELFVDDVSAAASKQMWYRMQAAAGDGKQYFVAGFKEMPESSPLATWRQTSTLYITVHDGADEAAPVLGRGVLTIAAADFARQLRTMRITSAETLHERLLWTERFGRFFAGSLWEQYGSVLGAVSDIDYEQSPRKRRTLRVGPPEVHDVRTADDVLIRLTRYRGGSKGPVVIAHGLGVSSLIFAIDTIETNLLEYLFAAGYDCWLLDYRSSTALPKAVEIPATGDDIAKYDYPAAVAKVRELTGAPTVQIVAHCYGATTLTLALLGGYLSKDEVRSVVISQISCDVRVPRLTRLKSMLRLPDEMQFLGIKSLDAYTDAGDKWWAKALDRLVALYALPVAQGRCHDPVCHRITFLYGSLYRHDRLNCDTHDVLHEMFGVAVIQQLRHLARMVRSRRVVDAHGKDVYYPHLDRMALPIAFIHGADNKCFLPASTEQTVAALSRRNGADLYTRHVVPGYGHIDCIYGENAATDIYPLMLAHLDAT